MNAAQAEAYLLDLELFGMRFGLDRMHKLMTALGMPQRRFASIHVVGSNGKSSTVRFAAGILAEHGMSVGTYTSPHLRSFAERIGVDGEPVTGADFANAVARVARAAELVNRTAAEDDRVTQFEALTAAAYHELARRGVEVAVIEAGLGGRWDATNVIPSRVQALTSVGLEHTRWLGPTVRHIAEEKLAVVQGHATLVVAPDLHPDAMDVAERVARERTARLVVAPAAGAELEPLRARGAFQRRNFAVARSAAGALLGERLDDAAVARAAASVEVPGRMQVVAERPLTIYDGAHNGEGAAALAEALPEVTAGRPLVGVVAILDDKDAAGMLRAVLPLCERVVFTRASNPRSLSPGTLETLAAQLGGPPAESVSDPRRAVARAQELAGPDGAVVAMGSIYLVADLVREPGAARASML
ncbi:MAG: dihydrofolate synthase / folylpolyglutamate synthase [Thermoleophilaceae bacterium]|nr:dihydrofolate synthase / folylpolyglutamate synthase [Thermoleophilaceae bacterium]